MGSVLLTNAQLRKTLATVRSLGQKGVVVTVAEETRMNPSAYSKYCRYSMVYPSAKNKPLELYQWLVNILKTGKYEVLFPMDDDIMKVAIEHREELEKLCSIPLPPTESYKIAMDKGRSAELAINSLVDCPKTYFPKDISKLKELVLDINFPVVIKPRMSSGSRGIRLVERKEDFISYYLEAHMKYPYPIVQEYIGNGDRYDVCLLFDKSSQLKASFVQKEIRHYPLDMGPSTIQESVWVPELIDKAMKLMRNLQWYGVVELEFMLDTSDGKFKLLEINPRFWNSLYMALIAGVDFPWILYKLAKGNEVEETCTYKTGLKCSNILPGDILHFVFNKNRRPLKPPFLAGKKHNTYDDIISKSDPLPTLGFVLACFRYLFDINMWRFIFKR